jgi:spore coat polysaccharide biosynthesis predicted glycosyltransferase SpsG
LRMSHLANNAPYHPNTTHNKIKRILVSCPMEISEATELSVKAVYATLGRKNLEILINFHPSSGPILIDIVKEVISNLPNCNHVNFTNEPARSLIKKSDLLIYNSSGTVFDAVREGVPSLYVGPVNGLDLCKLPGKEKVTCRTIENIRVAIDQIFKDPHEANKTVEKEFEALNQCFSEPSQSIWSTILNETSNTPIN